MPDNHKNDKTKKLEVRVGKLEKTLEALDYGDGPGIWLEVAEVQLDTRLQCCRVQLKADRAQPRPVWWRVENSALSSEEEKEKEKEKSLDAAKEAYRAILNELDKNREVLAFLSGSEGDHTLRCSAFRFQSAELGKRLS